MRDLLSALAETMNLISPDISNHHEQTAYLSYHIASQMKMSRDLMFLSVYASLVHDIGSVITEKPASVEDVEKDPKSISALGAEMLSDLPKLKRVSRVVRHCQKSWNELQRCFDLNNPNDAALSSIASIIHLSDRVSLMLNPDKIALLQVKDICEAIEAGRGSEYQSEVVDAFLTLGKAEYIWMDMLYKPQFLGFFTGDIVDVSLDEAVTYTKLVSRIIDYRSPFTAMHSAGVAASAKKLAQLYGMSPDECQMMEIAGNLHDIGKLKVPRAILEKPGRLTDEEFLVIKEHPYYTRLILMGVSGFEQITDWAGFHHEKLNGNGYPFHFDASALSMGSRIMAVADIFSAITEERPYRKGMTRSQAMDVMHDNVKYGAISQEIVELLSDHYEEIDEIRDRVSKEAGRRYFESLEGVASNI